jgi:LPS sulfotransferase NodH
VKQGRVGSPLAVPPQLRLLAREHAAVIEAALGPIRPVPGFRAPPIPALFLCFTNRCGSNYAAQLIASTGMCNEAGEFFNAATVLEHAVPRGLTSLQDYVTLLPDLVPRRPVLAAKLGLDQLVMLTDAGILDDWLPRSTFLLIERQDKLGQAISRVIAAQTGAWTSADDTGVAMPQYSAAAIASELVKIAAANAGFYAWFAMNGIMPVHTSYEQLLQNPSVPFADLAQRVGVDMAPANPTRVTLLRQATAMNEIWRARFSEEPPNR